MKKKFVKKKWKIPFKKHKTYVSIQQNSLNIIKLNFS